MSRTNPIRSLMATELAPVWVQKKKPFRPDADFVNYAYKNLNRYIFDGQLVQPEIQIGTLRKAWGWCIGAHDPEPTGSYCKIRLMDKWYSPQWFMNTLAHEMVHQWQYDIAGPDRKAIGQQSLMSHGPSFFAWRDRFQYYGLHLKTYHHTGKWFKYQNFNKC